MIRCPLTNKECNSEDCKVQMLGNVPVFDCRLMHTKDKKR